jgi:hypothetical protein
VIHVISKGLGPDLGNAPAEVEDLRARGIILEA